MVYIFLQLRNTETKKERRKKEECYTVRQMTGRKMNP